jgi:uncharacterized iron-regulated membrane protein
MRTVHRFVAVIAVLFALYVGSTGTFIQLVDLRSLLTHAPADDPNMQGLREGHDGPPNFQVIVDSDYSAADLPSEFIFDTALTTVLQAARAATAGAPISFLELRVLDGKPVGHVNSQGRLFRFEAATGSQLSVPEAVSRVSLPPLSRASLRNTAKGVHRMTVFGNWAAFIPVLVGLTLCVMIYTGLLLYLRLAGARLRLRRSGLFWFAGGWWRTLHRAIAIVASVFLLVVALSGTLLGMDNLGLALYRAVHHGNRSGLSVDVSSPLTDIELHDMLRITLSAYRSMSPGVPIKVLRLRHFAGMSQGVVVSGGDETRQWAFNAVTGATASEYGPGYPLTGQPFGWQEHQIAKQIHRGDFFGLTGRWMDLLTGLSMLFLALSGAVMYFDLWTKRRRAGRQGLFWR